MNQSKTMTRSVRLTESAIMLAFATVLSVVKILDLPYGGSITACSMLPVLIIAYRHGTAWGLFSALAFGLLQMLLGANNLLYATGPFATAMIVLFDYLIAFGVLGLGGLFRKIKDQSTGLALAALVTGALRYLCHIISGYAVWRDISIPSQDAWQYSIGYNGTYMIPETLITMVGAVYLSRVLDFRSESITRAQPQLRRSDLEVLLSGLMKTAIAAAVIFDVLKIAPQLQVPSTGAFAIIGLLSVDWVSVAVVTVICAALAVNFWMMARYSRKVPADKSPSLRGLFTAIPFLGVAAAAICGGLYIRDILAEFAAEPEGLGFALLQIVVIAAAVVAFFDFVLLRFLRKKEKNA